MQRRAARKSGRGGRAGLTGMARCGRLMRVFYKTHFDQSHGHRTAKPGRQFASDNSATNLTSQAMIPAQMPSKRTLR